MCHELVQLEQEDIDTKQIEEQASITKKSLTGEAQALHDLVDQVRILTKTDLSTEIVNLRVKIQNKLQASYTILNEKVDSETYTNLNLVSIKEVSSILGSKDEDLEFM